MRIDDLVSKLFRNKAQGVLVSGVVATLCVGVLLYVTAKHTILADPSAEATSRTRPAIDSETGKLFIDFKLADGESVPWKNPSTGKRTLYPAEACYWNKDGTARIDPVYVLRNDLVGKPGPTICPECGRTVVYHNPFPPTELMIAAAKKAGK